METGSPKASRLTHKPRPMAGICLGCEKHRVVRTTRVLRARHVRGGRALLWGVRGPGLWTSGARGRVDVPQ
jgi:hypothetical protein